ncbi:MAG: cupin domain-containing protein [Myxococcota bacterium]
MNTKDIKDNAPASDLSPTDITEWSQYMTDDEYYPYLAKPNIRPAKWGWDEVKPRLDKVAKDPLRRADRRFVTLVNADTKEAGGALPSVFIGLQIMNPGEHIVPHRHNSYALYHILEGEGYSVVGHGDDLMKLEWKRGDTLACPAWAHHEHFCTSDSQAIMYVIQDMPARAMERNLMWPAIGRPRRTARRDRGAVRAARRAAR